MRLSKLEFEQLLKEHKLVLSFIGMSNIGKTYWSKALQRVGFTHINCDDLIEERLAPILHKLGYLGIKDVSRWMGKPYHERFSDNQNKYLSSERDVMEEVFTRLKNNSHGNTVIDTTGSVVHTGKHVCEKLKQCSMVIYLEASKTMKEQMFTQYLKEPKPVVFGDVFSKKEGGPNIQLLSRCYQKLIDVRSTLYAQYADVIIPRESIEKNMPTDEFISLIKRLL